MNSWIALIGAIVGGGGMAGMYWAAEAGVLHWGVLAGVAAGLVLLGYILAAVAPLTGFGEFMRGFLVGTNAGLGGALGWKVGNLLFGSPADLIVGIGVGLLPFLSVSRPISQSEVYQGFLGWLNWILPMSWLIVALGFLFFLLNLLGHALLYWTTKWKFMRVVGLDVEPKTGTFFMRGGWISNLNPIDTAFNMGNFSFVDSASSRWHMEHEAGHTLNLGAFGSLVHLIGAVDENIIGRRVNAYTERLAESNDPHTSQSNIIPMWV